LLYSVVEKFKTTTCQSALQSLYYVRITQHTHTAAGSGGPKANNTIRLRVEAN